MNQRYYSFLVIFYLCVLGLTTACRHEKGVVTGWNYNTKSRGAYAYGGSTGSSGGATGTTSTSYQVPASATGYYLNPSPTDAKVIYYTSNRPAGVANGEAGMYGYEDLYMATAEKSVKKRELDGLEIKEHTKDHWEGQEEAEVVGDSARQSALAWGAVMYKQVPDYATLYERYNPFVENEWVLSEREVKSTFSIDVDNASYTNFRRFINNQQLPPKDAIRMEEWMNYFNYDLEAPDDRSGDPLKITSEVGACPWKAEDDLVMIKLQAQRTEESTLPASNLVFLVDVSGSMNDLNKLPLVQESMMKLVDKLRPQDKISIVAYAGYSGVVLEPTSGDKKDNIRKAINGLTSGGGTAGSEGIKTAYDLAEKHFAVGGNNRVILATDGDWNIGITDNSQLKSLIEKKRETGIFLSVMGFGMGNLNDQMMEMLADNGNGNYVYVDNEREADRVFGAEFAGTMFTIAKDVKLQIEFDPNVVDSYRLIGYENRVLENWMFEADSIDAGDLGVGQNVVAFYQVKRKEGMAGTPIGKVDFRYKPLDSDVSQLLSHSLETKSREVSSDYKFASCVAEFAMCLRESEYRGSGSMRQAIQRGKQNLGDPSEKLSYDKRVEFVGLMDSVTTMWEDYVLEEALVISEESGPDLKLFPNPAKDFTTVDVGEYLSGNWSVQIYDMKGAMVRIQHFTDAPQGRLDISGLTPATYILKVYTQGLNFGYLRLVVMD